MKRVLALWMTLVMLSGGIFCMGLPAFAGDAAVPAALVVGTAKMGTHFCLVSATPSKLLTSAKSGLVMNAEFSNKNKEY